MVLFVSIVFFIRVTLNIKFINYYFIGKYIISSFNYQIIKIIYINYTVYETIFLMIFKTMFYYRYKLEY